MGIALKYFSEAKREQIARDCFQVTSIDETKGEIHGLCPIHSESHPSFSYNYKKDQYNCFSCGAAGDLLSLWCEVNDYTTKADGFKAFCEKFSIDTGQGNKEIARPRKGAGHTEGLPDLETHLKILKEMKKAWDIFPCLPEAMIKRLGTTRGWSRACITGLDLRLQTHYLSKDGELVQLKSANRIAIPIYDLQQQLINIRLYEPGAKQFKIISWAKSTGASALFPARPCTSEELAALADDSQVQLPSEYRDTILLCEGESDTICAISHGFNAITQTSKLKKWPDMHLMPFKGKDVVIAYDADQPGQRYALYAAQALKCVAKSIRIIQWPSFMGIDDFGASPRDHGQDLTDFFVRHGKTAGDLCALIDAAKPCDQTPAKQNASGLPTASDTTQPGGKGVKRFYTMGIVSGRVSFRPPLVAAEVRSAFSLLNDPTTGLLYLYNGRFWEVYETDNLKQVIVEMLGEEALKSRVEDCIYQIKALSVIPPGRMVNDRSGVFCVENGMYSIDEDRLYEHAHDYYTTYMFPVIYGPETVPVCKRWIQFLNETIQTPEVIAQVQEFFGYCLTSTVKFEKCLLCLGPGADGKSTLLKILREMVGPKNCAAVNIEDLDDQFQRSSLYGKLLNISTEVGSKAMESKIFKAIVSGDAIQAAFKHENSFEFVPTCKMAFAANHFPRVLDNSDGFFRKILPVIFKKQFLMDADVDLFGKLRSELSGIFHWALVGLRRLRDQGGFTESDETQRAVLDYRRTNNPILCYVEDECQLGEDLKISKQDLYDDYKRYCHDGGYQALSKENFFRELYSAVNHLKQYRPSINGVREHFVQGIGLSTNGNS